MGRIGSMAKTALLELIAKDALTQAAAMAFFTALGLAPMILLAMTIAASFGEATQEALLEQVSSLIGSEAAASVGLVVRSAEREEDQSLLATVVALFTMTLSVAGIFAQFQTALNRIWNVEAKPAGAWQGWLRTRLLSIGLFLSMLFLMLVSLVVSAGIALALGTGGWEWQFINIMISWLVYVALFALIFKFLPDVVIAWQDVWIGAGLTACLFVIGKQAIGVYLGQSGVASSYGAAGSLIALLVWVYYSSLIVLLGAELTQLNASFNGRDIQPSEHAAAIHNGTTLAELAEERSSSHQARAS